MDQDRSDGSRPSRRTPPQASRVAAFAARIVDFARPASLRGGRGFGSRAHQRTTAVYLGENRLLVGTTIGRQRYAFYVEADDRLLTPWFALTGTYETTATDFLLRTLRPEHNCIDVGANFGYFLCLMARRCGRGHVLAVEPDPELAIIAQDNLFLNGLHEHSNVIRGAVADHCGELTLHRRQYRSGNTSICAVDRGFTDYMNEPPTRSFVAPSHSIDALAARMGNRVDVIKIDVEGAEPLVLAGATETVARNPGIVLLMEWAPHQITGAGFSVSAFAEQIGDLGLRCSLLDGAREVALPEGGLTTLSYQSSLVLRRKDRR